MKQSTKDWIQYGSAIALIASAIILVFVCFLLTLDVTAGVNTYVGVAFSCALAIYGVAAYMVSQVATFKTNIRSEIQQEIREEVKRERQYERVNMPNMEDRPQGEER